MDSMRNLHRSLPGSTPRHKRKPSAPPEDLLQTFKVAALSVTSLYKRAAEELSAERQAGYQDAVYDLLSFLDKENIGLETGEGWIVRRWATERQESGPVPQGTSDEEEEKDEERDDTHTATEEDVPQPDTASTGGSAREDKPDVHPSTATTLESSFHPPQPPKAENFEFHSPHPYPDSEIEPSSPSNSRHSSQSRQNSNSRTARRHSTLSRQSNRQRLLGAGAGSKRKVQFNDFFDLGNLSFGKDPFGHGPKRPRPS